MGKTGGLFPPDQRDVRGQRGEGQIEDFNRELATGIQWRPMKIQLLSFSIYVQTQMSLASIMVGSA
jgi:hypothetical protein